MSRAFDHAHEFEPATWRRAASLLARGAVSRVGLDARAQTWHGRVRGVASASHAVWLYFFEEDGRVQIDGDCNCGEPKPCAHLAALLMAVDRQLEGSSQSAAVPGARRSRAEPPDAHRGRAEVREAPHAGARREEKPPAKAARTRAEVELERRLARVSALAQTPEPASPRRASTELLFAVTLALIDEVRPPDRVSAAAPPRGREHEPQRRCVRLEALRVSYDARGQVHQVRPAQLDALSVHGYLPPEVGLDVLALWHRARAFEQRELGGRHEPDAVLVPPAAGSGALVLSLFSLARCHVNDIGGPRLVPGPTREATPQWRVLHDGAQELLLAPAPGESSWAVLPVAPPIYVDATSGAFGKLSSTLPEAVALELVEPLRVPMDLSRALPATVIASLQVSALPLPRALTRGVVREVEPAMKLRLSGRESALGVSAFAELWFDYDGARVRPGDPGTEVVRVVDDTALSCPRRPEREQAAIARLRALGAPERSDAADLVATAAAWQRFASEGVPALRAEGWQVDIDDSFEWSGLTPDGWYGDASEDEGDASAWFLELGVVVQGERINILPAVIEAIRSGRLTRERLQIDTPVLLPLGDGRRVTLEGARLQAIVDVLVELHDAAQLAAGKLSLSRVDLLRIDALPDVPWDLAPRLRAGLERLRAGPRALPTPLALQAELRGYQQQGFEWLQWLREANLGGLLADDMGLGKTVQALTHLLAEHEAGRMKAPALVVAPRSVLRNWAREAERFTPALRMLVYHGRERQAALASGGYQLVVTTYALLQRDELLLQQRWHTVVLDEAQAIKNPTTKVAVAAMKLDAQQRLGMTGTPMENHLGDLWSLMSFVNPGLLGNRRQFTQWYRTPIERDGEVGRFDALCRRIAPFMLRRTKAQVLTELPPKTEVVMYAELDGRERDLYESVRMTMEERVRRELVARGLAKSQIVVLDALLKLRQVCCHAPLTKLAAARAITRGSKLTLLLDLLEQLAAEGRRTLVFSQFTSMLEVIGKELHAREIRWSTITGRTTDRQRVVDEFQQGNVAVMLVSLKAGGTGLNLTAADTVIHYDPWWNPAVEAQASDRAHRIGQDKPVTVYRLICEGTVEERMVALQERKAALGRGIQESAQRRTVGGHRLDERDIAALLAPLGELDLPE